MWLPRISWLPPLPAKRSSCFFSPLEVPETQQSMILCSEAANKQLCELRLYLSFIFSLSSSTTLSLMEPFHGHLHIFKSLLSLKIKIKTENLPWSHFLLQLPLYFLLPLSSLELPVHTPCFHASHFMHPSCLQGFSILVP